MCFAAHDVLAAAITVAFLKHQSAFEQRTRGLPFLNQSELLHLHHELIHPFLTGMKDRHMTTQTTHICDHSIGRRSAQWSTAILACFFVSSGSVLLAQAEQPHPPSSINGTIDEQQWQWVVLDQAPHTSSVFTTLLPGVHNVRITGYASERGAREGSITIEFNLRNGEVQNPRLIHFPFSPLYPRFSFAGDHGTGELIIEEFDERGRFALVKGSFTGNLFYHQSQNTRPISNRTRSLDLEFQVVAERN